MPPAKKYYYFLKDFDNNKEKYFQSYADVLNFLYNDASSSHISSITPDDKGNLVCFSKKNNQESVSGVIVELPVEI